MRLWHQYLIKYLPNAQLLGQHRELCALRGLGFGKKHSVVNYVFNYPYYYLYRFHLLVMNEMKNRNFNIDSNWYIYKYRGKKLGMDNSFFTEKTLTNKLIYKEHDISYLKECLINLNNKNICISIKKNDALYKILLDNNLLNYIKLID